VENRKHIVHSAVTFVTTAILTAPIAYLSLGLNLTVRPGRSKPDLNRIVGAGLATGVTLGAVSLLPASVAPIPIAILVVMPAYALICLVATGLAATSAHTSPPGRSVLPLSVTWFAGA